MFYKSKVKRNLLKLGKELPPNMLLDLDLDLDSIKVRFWTKKKWTKMVGIEVDNKVGVRMINVCYDRHKMDSYEVMHWYFTKELPEWNEKFGPRYIDVSDIIAVL